MSSKKAALEKARGPTKNPDLHYPQVKSGLMQAARAIGFLVAFISLSCLLDVTVPTSTLAQTVSSTLDAKGWTVFTASSDTKKIYVSNSTGSDLTGVIGDPTHPYKTIAKGVSLLRSGYPDWLLLKKGDTWTDQAFEPRLGDNFNYAGRSATEPMIISSYDPSNPSVPDPDTGGARPLIKTANGQKGIFFIGG